MIKETHFECGDLFSTNKALENLGVEKQELFIEQATYAGIKIFENKDIPANEVRMISAKGEILKIFTITAQQK
jgi:hypothetical protein